MRKLTLLFLLLVLLLAGCAGGSGQPSASPPQLNTLKWGVAGITDVPTLDPALVSDPTSIAVASLIYGGLVRLDQDLRVQPDGADRWTISPNGKIYTFHIRPHLRYADGTPVAAIDFVSAIHRALGPDGSSGAASFYLGAIAHRGVLGTSSTAAGLGVTAPNPHTVQIVLTRPSAHFLTQLAFPTSFVAEPKVVDQYGPTWTDHATGFGPYTVETWSHTRYLTLVRNRYYWQGVPFFHRITLHFYPQTGALAAYEHGAIDVLSGLPAGENSPGNPAGTVRRPGLALDYLAFNTDRLPFHRLNARRAFAASIPSASVARSIDTGAFPPTGWLPSAFGISVPRWQPSRSPSAYLTSARYPGGHGFPPITLAIPINTNLVSLADLLARTWHQKLGVSVAVRALDLSSYNKVLDDRAFNAALVPWGAEYADPEDYLGTQLGPSPSNVTGWSTPKYVRDLSLANSYAAGDPRRTVLFRQAAELAARKLPLVPLDQPAVTAFIRPALGGIGISPLGIITFDSPKVGYR